MDDLLKFFVKQKKLALVFTVSIIALGLVTLSNIQRDQFPAVDFEVMGVYTTYPGASPEDVEQNVTNKIEDELKDISGIDNFVSTSNEGNSTIIIELSQDVEDIPTLKQEITNAVNRIRSLPEEVVDLPWVIDHKTSLKSILKVNIGSDSLSYNQLRDTVDDMANYLEVLDGVSKVEKNGYLEREIQIKINPDSLYKYELSIPGIISTIETRNKRYSVGDSSDKNSEKTIVVLAKYNELERLGDVIIKSSFEGPIIRLKDIAQIIDASEEEKSIIRVNGTKGFILKIKKQEKADIITTVTLVKDEIKKLQSKYKDIEVFYSSDLSKDVKNRLGIVTNNGLIGLVLVLIVLGSFLSFKTAFWVAVSLPVSLLGTVALLGLVGETINMVSLAAMILVLGIVVDDSIIVAESIHHYKQLGEDKYHSTLLGFKRVIMPVITTIITTIFAFSSMFLMTGIMGKFIYVIPLVIIFALTLSFLEVSLALPAHLASLDFKVKKRTLFSNVEDWFEGFLKKALKWRYLVIVIFSAVLVGSVYLALTQMKFVLFPAIGVNSISAKLKMPVGTPLEKMELVAIEVENLITDVVGDDIDSLTTDIGSKFTHSAKFTIDLVLLSERKQTSKSLLSQLKKRTSEITKAKELKFSVRRPGPPQGEDLEINLISSNDTEREGAADALEKILKNISGVDNIDRDDEPGKERIEVVLDFEKIARFNVDFATISRYLKAAFTGINVTDMRYGDNDVDFRIYLNDGKHTEDFIKEIKIGNRNGRLIPLKQFSNIRQIIGEPDFNHFNGQRSIGLSASVSDEANTAQAVTKEALLELDLTNNYPNVKSISEGGGADTVESMDSFKRAFIMSIFGIFLLLTLLFNSYSQPLLVLSAIPFSVVGVIWAFFFHGESISFFAMLGTLALVGVIVNDSLVMVSHLNYMKEKNSDEKDHYKWIATGAKDRLRAVVLTTLTTLSGVIPLAYGLGGTDYILQPMALSLGYGLLFGTLMTLILLPSLYMINYDINNWFKSKINAIRA